MLAAGARRCGSCAPTARVASPILLAHITHGFDTPDVVDARAFLE